jgi:hypothetical protein
MQTPLSKFKEELELLEKCSPKNNKHNRLVCETYRFVIYLLDKDLEKEKEQLLQFGNKMQIVSDVDFDGNIKFAFNPKEELEKQ